MAREPTAEEIELRARAERLGALEDLWEDEFSWRNLAIAGAVILVVISLLDLLVFALAGLSYPAWYLANGALLSLGVPILSGVGIDLDRRYGLISAHPLYFVASWGQIAADWSNIWEPTGAPSRYLRGTRWPQLDHIISRTLSLLLAVALIGWFLVSGPPQYLLNIVCGAPARSALASGMVVWDYLEVDYKKGPDGSVTTNAWNQDTRVLDSTAAKPNVGARRLGFDVKPVSVTYALAAAALFVVGAIVSVD